MRHQNSVLHDVLKRIPWDVFDRLVEQHGSDYRARRLSTKDHLVALLYGQLSGAASLREIEAGLASHRARLYHLGSRPVRRSTLADANEHRPGAVFAELFATMAGRVHRGLRRAIGEAVYLIDSTGIPLNSHSIDWARYSAKVCGAKLHVIYDPDADQPIYAAITPSRRNDITAAQQMPIEPGATYVFDLGYYDYGWWASMAEAGCRIVTRFKRNTSLTVVEERPLPEGSAILADRIGHLPERQSRNRHNPFQDPVREVRVMTDTGKILRILTNDIDATAQEIADLYKPEDPPLSRRFAERDPHPDHRCADRLSPAPPGPGRSNRCRQPARFRPPRPRQPHAAPQDRPPSRPRALPPRSAPNCYTMDLNLNRTAVGQARQ
jgi:hypothetical protein